MCKLLCYAALTQGFLGRLPVLLKIFKIHPTKLTKEHKGHKENANIEQGISPPARARLCFGRAGINECRSNSDFGSHSHSYCLPCVLVPLWQLPFLILSHFPKSPLNYSTNTFEIRHSSFLVQCSHLGPVETKISTKTR
jgi:hypothetical protein